MNYRVYLCYAGKDSVLAEDLKRRLKGAGVDFVTMEAAPDAEAARLRLRIRDTIQGASEVIALLTDNSVNNKWLLYEIGMADSLERPVTFVVADEGIERLLPFVGKRVIRYADFPEYLSSLKERAKAA